ncbi:MAG: PIN domain nuclease [Blastochloris sp.]|nr:PIN domain nuclease [Blastochloris sp.]
MEKSVLVDTNVFIELTRRRLDPVSSLRDWAAIDDRNLVTCGMIRLELLRGIRVLRHRQMLESLLDVMINVPTDNRIWEEATDLAWRLDRSGLTLPAQDILIATCAFREDAMVMTLDHHFQNIPGLELIPFPF